MRIGQSTQSSLMSSWCEYLGNILQYKDQVIRYKTHQNTLTDRLASTADGGVPVHATWCCILQEPYGTANPPTPSLQRLSQLYL